MADTHNSPVVEKKDFFISYTGQNKDWAEWIAATLEANGYSTVFQGWDFRPGNDFIVKMREAVNCCERLIAVFSPAYFLSGPGNAELNTYLGRDWGGNDRRVIPVLVEPVPNRDLLQSRVYIDISTASEDDARRLLLEGVSNKEIDRTAPRPFPGAAQPSTHSTAIFPRSPLPPNNLSIAGIVENEGYIPRAAQMAALEAALASGAAVALTQALRGDGGFGKTEIAKAFLYAHAREFAGLWWVDASAAGHALATDRLAEKLGINFPPDIDRDQLRRAICETLSQARHLLVLDNVDDPAVLGAWPVQQPAVRLVTTRLHGAAIERMHPVEVSELTPGEARALLRQHRDDLAGPEHEVALETIAAELGHHALAVALAGAWLANHTTRTPADLLAGLQTESHKISREVLQEMNPQGSHLGQQYARGVFATLTLHLGELQHPWSRSVLEISAFLHPGGIPLELLAYLSEDSPLRPPDSEAATEDFDTHLESVQEAIEELHVRSLFALDNGAAILHRLTQRAIRASMSPDSRNTALHRVLVGLTGLLTDALNPMKLAQHAHFIPHAAAAFVLARDSRLDAETGELGIKLANFLHTSADYSAALAAAGQAEQHLRAAFGDEHEKVAVIVSNRGSALQVRGCLDGALSCYEEAERIDRKVFGNDHPKVAIRINNRGDVFRLKGDFDSALGCFEEAERIDRTALGPSSSKVAIDVNNRGLVLQAKGDLDGALCCFEEVERIERKAFGDDHPYVARTINNRGSVLHDMGDPDGALRCYAEAICIGLKTFGDDHPFIATCVNNYGSVLYGKGDLDGARACFREAFSICIRKLGPRAGDTLMGAGNLVTMGIDPIALAREIAGVEVAADLERYFREWVEKRS